MHRSPGLILLSFVAIGMVIFQSTATPQNVLTSATTSDLIEAARLQAIADSLWGNGDRVAAVDAIQKALALRQRALSPEHLLVASSLSKLGWFYREQGRWAEAESLLRRSLAMQEAILGPDHHELIPNIRHLSNLIQERGRYDEAEPFFHRLIALQAKALGPKHLDVATSMNNLANNCRNQGRDEEAGALFLQALKIREEALGVEDPDVGASMNNLAVFYQDRGRYAEAESLHQCALSLFEKVLGPDHPYVAESLSNIAALYRYQGRYPEAEPLLQRALRISERAVGSGHQDVGWRLQDIASLYETERRYAEAEPLLWRALKILKNALGEEHPEIGKTLTYLAQISRDQGRNTEAEALFSDALKIFRKGLRPEHPTVGDCYENLAQLYAMEHRYAEAESLFQLAVSITRKALGDEHPHVAVSLGDLASCYAATGRTKEAMTSFSRSMHIEQMNMGRVFSVSSERAMRDYLATVGTSLDRLFSLVRASGAQIPNAADSALIWTLRRKAVVVETLIRFQEARALLSQDPAIVRDFGELRVMRARLDRLETGPMADEQAASEMVAIRRACERLEAQMNRRISERFPNRTSDGLDLQSVRRAIPHGSALVEFAQVKLFDFGATSMAAQWTVSHHFAFVLTSKAAPALMVDLGDADAIDREVRRFRESFRLDRSAVADETHGTVADRDRIFATRSHALYKRLFAPLRRALGGIRTVYLAPDGELNRVPFEALVDGRNRYLIESYRFAYLTSGRELLEPAGTPSQGTVVFAAPDYDLGVRDRMAQARVALATSRKSGTYQFRGPRSIEAKRWAGWSPLPGTTKEAEDVRRELTATRYGPVHVYSGRKALEEVLKALMPPRVLHIATHGYFFPDQRLSPSDSRHLFESVDPLGGGQRLSRIQSTENPLIRSGFILAGANSVGAEEDSLGVDDGWVSAEEIGMMNLRGTELVVLSGCETGLADVRLGEGVSGLRRAFRYAGARTLVMSFSQVDDQVTRTLMRQFCRGLATGLGKLDALRQAKLAVMQERKRRTGSAQPSYWASFVLVGDPN